MVPYYKISKSHPPEIIARNVKSPRPAWNDHVLFDIEAAFPNGEVQDQDLLSHRWLRVVQVFVTDSELVAESSEAVEAIDLENRVVRVTAPTPERERPAISDSAWGGILNKTRRFVARRGR